MKNLVLPKFILSRTMICLSIIGFTVGLVGCNASNKTTHPTDESEKTIHVALGTQDTTINCAAGGLLIRELDLLPKYLPKDGQYKNVKYDIEWKNFTSGAPLTSEMVAGRLDIGVMAEFPAVNNYVAFQKIGQKSIFLTPLSGSIYGSGNSIVVPIDSKVTSLKELKGQTISVPFASTAHGMLLRAVEAQGWDPNKDIHIISQAPEVAGPALKSNKISAHADFVPFGELFQYQGFAKKIFDGGQTNSPTFHGAIANDAYAKKYPEIIKAYLEATLEANRLIAEEPEKYSQLISDKTGIPAEVIYLYHGPLGLQTRDLTWKPEYRKGTQLAMDTLKLLGKNDGTLKADVFIDDQYIRAAFQAFGLNYDKDLKNYAQQPLVANDALTGEPIKTFNRVMQIWVKGEEKVRSYATPENGFKDLKKLIQSGQTIRAVYNQDFNRNIKLLANFAWFASNKAGQIQAFLSKEDAEKFAQANGGKIFDFKTVQTQIKPA